LALTTPSSSLNTVPVRTAVRFPLQLEVTLSSRQGECHAVTENVSANGMLFLAEDAPDVGAQVEFELKMPAAIMGGEEDVVLHCVGRIVRHMESEGRAGAAAVIDEYSLRAEK
jgi:hypothetical protein